MLGRCLLALLICLAETNSASGQLPPATPRSVELTNGIGISFSAPWFIASRTRNAVEIAYPFVHTQQEPKVKPGEKPRSGQALVTAAARIAIETDQRPSHADALTRLAQIASEVTEPSSLLVIAGWPAIQRRRTAPLPNPGESEPPLNALATFSTIAIAADTVVIRFEATIAPGADPELIDEVPLIAHQIQLRQGNPKISQQELGFVSRSIHSPNPPSINTSPRGLAAREVAPRTQPNGQATPGTVQVRTGIGEIEIAVSGDGKHAVVASNSGYSYSDDGGKTFTFGGGTPCIYNGCDGDPSLAVGKSGAVYYSWIGFPTNETGTSPPPNGSTDSVSVSTDGGHTFTFDGNAVVCPTTTPAVCSIPDQPHIAADEVSLSSTNQDRVYLVWRNFSNVGVTSRIVCSSDGGSTWINPTTIDAAGDFPRVTVGRDGNVYAVYVSGSNLMLRKFSSCDSGLTPQPSVNPASFVWVPCPVPGLDRCNDGNVLSSPSVAVDPGNANHTYVAWATSTGAGNEDIMVAESNNGGLTFGAGVRVNSPVAGRRFMPWLCSTSGSAWVSWYDRRNATNNNNDLTRYFLGSMASGSAGPERDLSGNSDPECASHWQCGSGRSIQDSESCSVQPELAGFCKHTPPSATDSNVRCDFNQGPACPATESCQADNFCPTYGDYNGNACVAGQVFAAWASGTAPSGLPAVSSVTIFSSVYAPLVPSPPSNLTVTPH